MSDNGVENGVEVRKNPEAMQYEAVKDGKVVSLASYHDADGVVTFPHTETDPEYQGQGLAGQVVSFALDDVVSEGKEINPVCPYVVKYVAEHTKYQPHVVGAK